MPAREVPLRPATLEDAEAAVVGLAVVDGRAFGGIAAARRAR